MSLRVRWKHSRNQPTKFLSSKEKKVRRDCKACWNRSHSKMWEEELTRSRRTWGSGLLFLPPPATQRTLCSHQRARPRAGLSGRPGIPATAHCRGPHPPLGTHKADDATRTRAAHRQSSPHSPRQVSYPQSERMPLAGFQSLTFLSVRYRKNSETNTEQLLQRQFFILWLSCEQF